MKKIFLLLILLLFTFTSCTTNENKVLDGTVDVPIISEQINEDEQTSVIEDDNSNSDKNENPTSTIEQPDTSVEKTEISTEINTETDTNIQETQPEKENGRSELFVGAIDTSKYDKKLVAIAEQNNYVKYSESEISQQISQFYLPVKISSLISESTDAEKINEILPIENVKIIRNGFIIYYPMEDKTLAIYTDMMGSAMSMFFYADELYDKTDVLTKVQLDMTKDEIFRMYPAQMIYTDDTTTHIIASEILCEDGTILYLEYAEVANVLKLKSIEFESIDNYVIDYLPLRR
jgi:lipoprotein